MIDVSSYIGREYTVTHNCFYWFRRFQREIFGNGIDTCLTITTQRQERRRWKGVANPIDGDAVWMSSGIDHPHHIGVWVNNGILHAVDGVGVVHDTLSQLSLSSWIITGFERRVDHV